jgi:hypothetical protein
MGLLGKDVVKNSPKFDKRGKVPPDPKSTGGAQHAVAEKIRQYHAHHARFQGIVLKSPVRDFAGQVSRMVSSFGSVFPLPPEKCLILFPETVDWELLAHRLSKSLNIRVLYLFPADDPGMALQDLTPYW